jgi:hypothetical protein
MWLTDSMAGQTPTIDSCGCRSFYRLYTTEAGVLLLLRLVTYRYAKQHYYL